MWYQTYLFSALYYHFQTMPLPSPLSWYSHHLPDWYLRLIQIFANVTEIVLPFLFLIPIRSVRLTSFVFQVTIFHISTKTLFNLFLFFLDYSANMYCPYRKLWFFEYVNCYSALVSVRRSIFLRKKESAKDEDDCRQNCKCNIVRFNIVWSG